MIYVYMTLCFGVVNDVICLPIAPSQGAYMEAIQISSVYITFPLD